VGTLNRWMGQLAQNLRLAELWNRGVQNYESLEGADRSSFDACMLQLFHIFAEMYSQQVEGHLDPRLWHQVEKPMRGMINKWPGIQAWWR